MNDGENYEAVTIYRLNADTDVEELLFAHNVCTLISSNNEGWLTASGHSKSCRSVVDASPPEVRRIG